MGQEKYNWKEIFIKLDKGISYRDIIDEHGMAYATLVRKYNGFKAGELATRELNFDKETLDKIVKKELNVLKEQKKNTLIKKEAHKLTRTIAITDILVEAIEKLVIKPYKVPVRDKIKVNDNKLKEIVWVVSDLHYLNDEKSASLNKMGQMWLDSYNGAENPVIVFNGDLIENTHHLEQLLNEGNPMEQAANVAQIIASQIKYFLDKAPNNVKLGTEWVVGNHDEIRQLSVKAGETKKINIVSIVAKLVEAILFDYVRMDKYYSASGCDLNAILPLNYHKYNDIVDIERKELEAKGKEHYYTHLEGSNTINIRHGHQFKSNDQKAIEFNLIKEAIQGHGFDALYVISHFHQFRNWVMKGSSLPNNEEVMVVMTPSMKDWNGEFEIWNNTRNTSGMISIDENKNINYIRIPKE